MKIPTLLGIALIIAIIGAIGVYFYFYRLDKTPQNLIVSDLQEANITNTQAVIVWQTDSPVVGEVVYSETEALNNKAGDQRDNGKEAVARLTHFVTLNNLKPDTRYFYKIKNGSQLHPETVREFRTGKAPIDNQDELNFSFLKPLKGTILNVNLNPTDESLVFLKIPGAENLATFSSTSGNFILPLKLVLNEGLDQFFSIAPDTPAVLLVKRGNLQSEVKITIADTTVNLPPITLGNNLDLINFKPQPISTISFDNEEKQTNLDFNDDNTINSLDLAILRGRVSSRSLLGADELRRFDISGDGALSQTDIDEFSRALTGN